MRKPIAPAAVDRSLRQQAASVLRKVARRIGDPDPRRAVTIRHQTIWAGGAMPRLTVAIDLPVQSGEFTLTLGGRPLMPTREAGVWEVALADQPSWADGPLPLTTGRIRIEAALDGVPVPVRTICRPSLVAGGVRFGIDAPGRLRVLGPHTDEVRTPEEKDAACAAVMGARRALVDAVYLEVFSGRQAGFTADSPGAIAEYLAEHYPDLPLIWGCRDGAALAQVPDGHTGVLIGSREWAEAITTTRWLVVNDWLDRRFTKRKGQVVLQTWHGSTYKTIGLDRLNRTPDEDALAGAQATMWDLLLSQNPASSDVFCSAYDWTKPLLEVGYPRNDRLAAGLVDRDTARRRLGITDNQRAVLYAPTYRDAGLDPAAVAPAVELAERLGERFVVLARSHGRTEDAFAAHPRVVDVTRYPDLADLMAASDMLVTDYSSMMFDYAHTGRPMVFLAPDLAEYEASRGAYFDLRTEAPGPVCATLNEAVAALQDDDVLAVSAMQLKLWRQRWLPWDDGKSAERAVRALLDTRAAANATVLAAA